MDGERDGVALSAVGKVTAGGRCVVVVVGIFATGQVQADEAAAGAGDGGSGVVRRQGLTVVIRLASGDAAAGIDDGLADDEDECSDLKWVLIRRGRRQARRRRRGLRRPDLAALVDVDLRLRWIWDGLDLVVMMDRLDYPTGCSPSMGFTVVDAAFVVVMVVVDVGIVVGRHWAEQRRWAMAVTLMGSEHRIGPCLNSSPAASMVMVENHTGAPRVYHIRYMCSLHFYIF
ncbi:hypothetical protein ACLOJK_007750 [Asimina triloba]